MPRIKLILFALLLSASTFAQSKMDSLLSIWQDESQSDSVRTYAYKAYIWDGFLFSNPDSAAVLAEGLLDFGRENNYTKAEALGFNIQGISYAVRGEYPNALKHYNQSRRLTEQIGDQKGTAIAYNNIGNIYYNQGDYPRALSHFTKSLTTQEQIQDTQGIARSLNNIGMIYSDQSSLEEAMEYFQRSLSLAEKIKDNRGISRSLNNIGNVLKEQGKYSDALDYYSQGLEIDEILDDQGGIAISLGNIGFAHNKMGDFDQAMDYYNQSLKIHEEVGDQEEMANTLQKIGSIYRSKGNQTKALNYCKKSYELAKSIESLQLQQESCSCLYNVYKAKGDGNKALEYHEQLDVINESLDSEETAKELLQMEFQKQVLADSIEQVEKDLLVEMAHQDEVQKKNKTRNILAIIGILVLILAGGFYRRWTFTKKEKAAVEVEKGLSDNLLLNMLPAEIAAELKEKGEAAARDFETVSILFTDFKGFTKMSENLSAQDLVEEINHCFKAFDRICGKYNVEKIKTIGDAYMAAGGLPIPSESSVKNTVLAALEMQAFIEARKSEKTANNQLGFTMRAGINTGSVVAGIVGVKKFQYDIWGDTVNTASRMESSGEVGQVNISQYTYDLIKDDPDFVFESRGKIQAKGKGDMEMYFVDRA